MRSSRTPSSSVDSRRTATRGGFTMIELIIAMSLLSMLGIMIIAMMSDGMRIFSQGMSESAELDRTGTILPTIRADISKLLVPDAGDPPPPPAPIRDLRDPEPQEPAPPVWERLISGYQPLKNQPEGPTKDMMVFYAAWVIDISSDMPALLRTRGGAVGDQAVPYTPLTVEKLQADTRYLASGGQMEVAYVAVPTDPANPAILTLYRGFRAPVGDPLKSLLIPENLDTLKEIQEACRPVAEGLLHFQITWRRIHATSWAIEESKAGPLGERSLVVSPRWDSTRGVDPKFPMFAGKDSLGDGSDDVFPGYARVDITVANEGVFGYGQGALQLSENISGDITKFKAFPANALYEPVGASDPRFLKIGTEWMEYDIASVDTVDNSVYVRRGARNSAKQAHESGAWLYVGLPDQTEIRMPVYMDRYAMARDR